MKDRAAIGQPDMRPRWWQWPTVLSVDAPVVTITWLVFLGRQLEVDIGWRALFVLGTSVWLAYAADRLIEGWRLPPGQVITPRHHFYQRWRGYVTVVGAIVLAADLVVAATGLSRTEWITGWLLTAAVATYLLSHQLVHRTSPWRVPKEVCVAGLLTGGIAVFLVESIPLAALVAPLSLFAALCFVNCVLISRWEREVDRSHQQSSLAQDPRQASWIGLAPWLLAVMAAVAAAVDVPLRTIAACTAVSALLLAAVDRLQPGLGWRPARVLADLVLLTPIVPLLLVP